MQIFEGIITSSKTANTIAVEVVYFAKHAKYKKVLKRTTNLLVHNETPGLKEGDKVEVTSCKPYSKLKHFMVTKKL